MAVPAQIAWPAELLEHHDQLSVFDHRLGRRVRVGHRLRPCHAGKEEVAQRVGEPHAEETP